MVPDKFSLTAFTADESGATAIEYGFISAAIALVLVPALSLLTSQSGNMFQKVIDAFATIH